MTLRRGCLDVSEVFRISLVRDFSDTETVELNAGLGILRPEAVARWLPCFFLPEQEPSRDDSEWALTPDRWSGFLFVRSNSYPVCHKLGLHDGGTRSCGFAVPASVTPVGLEESDETHADSHDLHGHGREAGSQRQTLPRAGLPLPCLRPSQAAGGQRISGQKRYSVQWLSCSSEWMS